MKDEEVKAILKLKEYVKSQKEELNMFGYITTLEIDLKNTETVLNLIEKQKAEIEKKDKIIDNLVGNLRYYNGMQQDDIFCNQICSNKENCDRENCYYRIKEYFENKVKEK